MISRSVIALAAKEVKAHAQSNHKDGNDEENGDDDEQLNQSKSRCFSFHIAVSMAISWKMSMVICNDQEVFSRPEFAAGGTNGVSFVKVVNSSIHISREFGSSALNNITSQVHDGNVILVPDTDRKDFQMPRTYPAIGVSPKHFIATVQLFDVFHFHGITLRFLNSKSISILEILGRRGLATTEGLVGIQEVNSGAAKKV